MTTDEQRLSVALREWTDALPVELPAGRHAVASPARTGRPWAMALVAATVVLVVVGLWVIRRDGPAPVDQPAPSTTVVAPEGSGLFLSQTQFRSGTINTVMLVTTLNTAISPEAELQRWTGSAWVTEHSLPIGLPEPFFGQSTTGELPGEGTIGLFGTNLLHVELPALDPGRYRIALTDTVSAVIDVCADCTPVAGPPLFDLPMRVEPVLITDATDSVSIIVSDEQQGLTPPTPLLTVQRWTGDGWVDAARVTDLQQLLSLPDGAYRIWDVDLGVEVAGFFVQRSVDLTPSAVPVSVELRGVMACAAGALPDQSQGMVAMDYGPPCALSTFGTDASVFQPDATVAELDGTSTVTASLWPGFGEDSFNALATNCFEHSERCSSGRIAVLVDGVVVTSPTVSTPTFSGSMQFAVADQAAAQELAEAINATASPVAPTTTASEDFPAPTFSLLLVAPPEGYSLDWARYDSLTEPGSHAVARYSGAPGAPLLVVLMRSAPDFFARVPADRPTWTINGRTIYNDNQGDTCDPDACSIGVQWDEQTAVSVMWVTDDGTSLGPGHDIESLLVIIEQLAPADRADFSEGSIDWAE